jgi:hypothetical protein
MLGYGVALCLSKKAWSTFFFWMIYNAEFPNSIEIGKFELICQDLNNDFLAYMS